MLRKIVGAVVRQYPGLFRPIWPTIYPYIAKPGVYPGHEYKDRASAFKMIHDEQRWISKESVSGHGSELANTILIRKELPELLRSLGVKTFLDAPCGDLNWMSQINIGDQISYIGGYIVPAIVEQNSKRFANNLRKFVLLDIAADQLPASDVWLCRHVLFHLSNEDVLRVLRNFVRSDVKYMLADTAFFIKSNVEIRSGGFRLVNLCQAPFNLPKPSRKVWDISPPHPPNFLCLWSKEEVAKSIGASLRSI